MLGAREGNLVKMPLFTMPRRLVLPGCELGLSLGRSVSFRLFEETYSRDREVFMASGSCAVGVVARVVTLVHLPTSGDSADRVLLRGVRRARLVEAPAAGAREAEIERLDDRLPREIDDETREQLAALDSVIQAVRAPRLGRPKDTSLDPDAATDKIQRIYRFAVIDRLAPAARQAMLEADGLARKAAIATDAYQEQIDVNVLEARILTRLDVRSSGA